MKSDRRDLPYINNFIAVAVTALIAVISVLIFMNRDIITLRAAMIDAVSFGVLTFLIDTAIVYPQIRKKYLSGRLPENPPDARILSRMPRNPVIFAVLSGLLFIGITVLFNWAFFRFYQLESMAFGSFMFFRVIYAVFFSAWMTKIIILRYVQPGAFKENVPQHGSAEVKSAFPQISTLKEEFNSARSDFGLNMILGVILGGTRVGMDLGLGSDETRWLFIFPTYRSGLPLSVFIYGIIIYLLMMVPVVKSIRNMKLQGQLPQAEKPDFFFARLPKSPWAYAAVWFVPMLIFAYLFIWGVMTVMHFDVLNFFQYFFIRLACTKLLTKAVVGLSVQRYIQPDTDL